MLSVPTDEAALVGLRTQFGSHWLGGGEAKAPVDDAALYRVLAARPLGNSTAQATRHRLRIKDRETGKFGKEDRALIFVHGYNSSFGGSLLRIAQIAASTKYQGRIYFFSWPSAATYSGYVYDMDSAERSELHLTGFLRAILLDPELKKIDIVAHSMGSQMVLRSLTDLSNIFFSRDDIRLGELIFAAPDLSVGVFQEKIREIGSLADGITVYASRKDKALLISRLVRGQRSRLGLVTGKYVPAMKKVRFFDATSPNNICNAWGYIGLEHNYFSENASVLRHMTQVLIKAHGKRGASGGKDIGIAKEVGPNRFKLKLPEKTCMLSRLRVVRD